MKTFAAGLIILFCFDVVGIIEAHGAMNLPRSRSMGNTDVEPCPDGGSVNQAGCTGAACMWFNQGCCIGCNVCVDTFNNILNFSSACGLKKAPDTLPTAARTLKDTDPWGDFTQHHPWRSPGKAPMLDSCGLAGGSVVNNDRAGGYGNGTIAHKQGARGSELPRLDAKWTLKWTAGEEAEVSWGITANHGGGYQYRLCPASQALTEDCFQKTPLAFSGKKSRLRWRDGHEVEIDAVTVTAGTTPSGSEWRRNPIPTCAGLGLNPCDAPQFPPPKGCNDTCWGYQPTSPSSPSVRTKEMPAIVDKVVIPQDLPPGDYVVGWRWDCEQTPQIWAGCGDVVITKSSPSPPKPAPAPGPAPAPRPAPSPTPTPPSPARDGCSGATPYQTFEWIADGQCHPHPGQEWSYKAAVTADTFTLTELWNSTDCTGPKLPDPLTQAVPLNTCIHVPPSTEMAFMLFATHKVEQQMYHSNQV